MQRIRLGLGLGVAYATFVLAMTGLASEGRSTLDSHEGSVPSSPLPLKVVGTHVVNSRGERVRLRGVNAACLEWTSNGEGHILETVKTAISDWHVNHIRLPLAQDRWFGKAPEQKDDGKAYRALVKQVVDALRRAGLLRHPRSALVGRRRVGQADRPARDARPEQPRRSGRTSPRPTRTIRP